MQRVQELEVERKRFPHGAYLRNQTEWNRQARSRFPHPTNFPRISVAIQHLTVCRRLLCSG